MTIPKTSVVSRTMAAKFAPLFAPTNVVLINRQGRPGVKLVPKTTSMPPVPFLINRPAKPTNLTTINLKSRTFQRGTRFAGIGPLIADGVTQLTVPPGARYANVATIKRMLKVRWSETVLRQRGGGWEICPDSFVVDLLDDSVEFRIGTIRLLS